jgi:hypothetical protein
VIVCHRHRFIFIATRQTAASAIETELARVCAGADIVTTAANGGAKAGHNDRLALSQYRPVDWLKLVAFGARARLDEHAAAMTIRELVGVDVWNSYFKFCVERDPWDKAVAHHRERVRRSGAAPPIAEYLAAMQADTLSNFDLYTIDGALAVDRVIRFEHLEAELDAVGHLLDLPIELRLPPHADRAAEVRYAAMLGAAGRKVVDTVCRREIQMFGYAFRETTPEDR